MRPPAALSRHSTLICSLVIVLTTTTVIRCTSTGDQQPVAAAAGVAPEAPAESPKLAATVTKPKEPQASFAEPAAKSAAAAPAEGADQEANSRKGRSEPPLAPTERPGTDKASGPSATSISQDKSSTSKPAVAEQQQQQQKQAAASKPGSPASASPPAATPTSKQQLSAKSGASPNKKLPANLGTVTSTGSGGPSHYMSKHDAYSAIAEKHGALAQDAMKKADKRTQSMQRFGGIQKAGGLGDALNPFKGVSDSGLARTLGASVRSIIKGKYSVPAYVASAVLGAVALMAFYESPISPLPVPALPEPPVGRFPPELPNISPNLQVPFRMNGQQQQQQQQYGQGYANQRSSQASPAANNANQPQQVLFPGATAQQRQMGAPAGPVQQLAANLISSVGAKTAQRKSGLDYEPASSRSFFGSSSSQQQKQQQHAHGHHSAPGIAAPANQHHKQGAASSLLSLFGLGAGSAPANSNSALGALDVQRASGLAQGHQIAAGGGPVSSASGTEQKGQALLSNSHLVNKMKSYFERPISHNVWPMDHYKPSQYDQYRRMSIVQALAKDTAFLSSFFTPARRSSNSTNVSASQLQQSISNILAAASPTGASPGSSDSGAAGSAAQANPQQGAAARMQVDSPLQPLLSYAGNQHPYQQQSAAQPLATPIVNTKRASSGYGLMRAADRVAHTLLDTFTSGLLHRSSPGASQQQADTVAARKSEEQQQQQNALASATSILSAFMSSYTAQSNAAAASAVVPEQSKQQQQQQHQPQSMIDSGKQQQQQQQQQQQVAPGGSSEQVASGRSLEQSPAQAEQQVAPAAAPPAAAPSGSSKPLGQQSSASPESGSSSAQQPQPLVRKTRSIGLEYPMVDQINQYQYLYQQQHQPSRATQINNLVDLVSDSYKQNKILFNFVMNQVGLSQALPYVEQILGSPNEPNQRY